MDWMDDMSSMDTAAAPVRRESVATHRPCHAVCSRNLMCAAAQHSRETDNSFIGTNPGVEPASVSRAKVHPQKHHSG